MPAPIVPTPAKVLAPKKSIVLTSSCIIYQDEPALRLNPNEPQKVTEITPWMQLQIDAGFVQVS